METRRNFFKSLAAAAMAVPAAFAVANGKPNHCDRKLAKFKYNPSELALNNVETLVDLSTPITSAHAEALAFKHWEKVVALPGTTKPNMVYCVKPEGSDTVKLFVTDKEGTAFPVA